jgi:uncharacterized protein involved in copper resistance
MLKPYVVVAAALSAFVVPVIGAQLAVAAEPSGGLHAPVVMPNATPSPVPSASPSTEGDMAGMDDQMPGMSHGKGTTTQSSSSATEQASSHSHSGEEATSGPRPAAAVVTGFAAINGGVLLIAAATRRRDKRLSATSSRPARPAK